MLRRTYHPAYDHEKEPDGCGSKRRNAIGANCKRNTELDNNARPMKTWNESLRIRECVLSFGTDKGFRVRHSVRRRPPLRDTWGSISNQRHQVTTRWCATLGSSWQCLSGTNRPTKKMTVPIHILHSLLAAPEVSASTNPPGVTPTATPSVH